MVLNTNIAEVFLAEFKALLQRELLETWKQQGHYMDGSVVKSADFVVEQTMNKLQFLVYMFPYAAYMEAGVPASKIPFSGTGGSGGTSKYIQALIRYAMRKMALPEKEAKSVAFAIAHKQKKEGLPTSASLRFSSSGKRTGWIQDTIVRTTPQIEALMYRYVDNILTSTFENVITRAQQQFKTSA